MKLTGASWSMDDATGVVSVSWDDPPLQPSDPNAVGLEASQRITLTLGVADAVQLKTKPPKDPARGNPKPDKDKVI